MEPAGPYAVVDLKSFYASAECVERGLDPLNTNLLVADPTRSDTTICLAVSPSLKVLGIPGRPRLFEAKQKITEAQARLHRKIDYIIAPPRMALYLELSAKIYGVYLKYIAPQDCHPYSIDEVFFDFSHYLGHLHMTARELTMTMIRNVLRTTASPPRRASGATLTWLRLRWTLWRRKRRPTRTASALQNWTNRNTRSCCGITSP